MSALHWAVKRDFEFMADLLLRFDSDATLKDTLNRSPLWYAVRNKNTRLVKKLLIARAIPDDPQENLMVLAGENFIIQMMLKKALFISIVMKMEPPNRRYKLFSWALKSWLDRFFLD